MHTHVLSMRRDSDVALALGRQSLPSAPAFMRIWLQVEIHFVLIAIMLWVVKKS